MPPSTIILDNIVAVLRRSPPTVVHQDRHHAVVLTELFPDTLLDHQAERVLEHGGAVVSVLDRSDLKTYDYINRVVITLPLSVYEGT